MQAATLSQKKDSAADAVHSCTVVLDSGSCTVRAGVGSDERPSVVIPSIVGRWREATERSKDGVFFGEEALAKGRETLRFSFPVCWGLVQNWEDLTEMWTHVFEERLKREMEQCPLVVMESAYMVPKYTREKQTELAFETFEVPFFCLASAPAAVLRTVGRDTGVVIDIGKDNVRVTPVYEGYSMRHVVMKFEMGGEHLTDHLHRLLSQKGASLGSHFLNELRRVKEELAYVAQDYEQEQKTFSASQDRKYTLTNGDVLTLSQERFQCVEVLFQPNLLGMEIPGLAEHVVMTLSKCSPDIRQSLLSNVVVVGGGSKLPGLATRLQHDVERQLRAHDQADLHGLQVQVLTAAEGDLTVWQGGACLVRRPEFPETCISKAEYDEYGPTLVHKKCY